MIDIPQDVRIRVAAKLYSVVNRYDSFKLADAIIPLAQLPIAPATEADAEQFKNDYAQCPSKVSASEVMGVALNKFISRRNSPPKVDPLVEKIIAVQHRVRIEAAVNCTIGRPDTVLREAEAIAAEVRKFAALDAMKGNSDAQR